MALSRRVRHARRLPRRFFFLPIRSRHNRRICSWLRGMVRPPLSFRAAPVAATGGHAAARRERERAQQFEQVLRNSRLMRRPGVQVKRIMAFNEEESW